MVDISKLHRDLDLETNGVWFAYPDGGEFLIARAGNPKAEGYAKKLQKIFKSKSRGGALTDDDFEEIAERVAAKHILLDMRGVTSGGEDVAVTEEFRLSVFQDPIYADLANWILMMARDMANYKEESDARDSKN